MAVGRMAFDDTLVEQLKGGQSVAYSKLVERFEGPLYRFFLCDHRNHHLAEEQTAETFAQLVQSLPAMRGGAAQLRAYIFSTARHVQLRRWRRREERPSTLAEAMDLRDPGPTPENLADMREQAGRALKAIGLLDDQARQVLFLRFVEGCSIDEIGQAMEIPVGTVKSHISRGRARLKSILANEEYNHDGTR
jgi:RNA polymerase sigma-70 factor (ECF subfamily)